MVVAWSKRVLSGGRLSGSVPSIRTPVPWAATGREMGHGLSTYDDVDSPQPEAGIVPLGFTTDLVSGKEDEPRSRLHVYNGMPATGCAG